MPDNVLKLIPLDPQYVPEASAQFEVKGLLATMLPDAESIKVTVTDHVRFIDQGANFESVFCPNCGSELDRRWWQQAMNAAAKIGFSDLQVITPCCGSTLSLNNLRYVWPAGFARFVLEARNPNGDVSDENLRQIGRLLNSDMRKILAHY